MFASDLLNTCWVEDILQPLQTIDLNSMAFKLKLKEVYSNFLEAGNYCDMGFNKLHEYIIANKAAILEENKDFLTI